MKPHLPLFSDSHCHLDILLSRGGELSEILTNAEQAGVLFMVNPGVHWNEFDKIAQLSEKVDNLYFGLGVHPNEVTEEDQGIKAIQQHLPHEKMVAVGETGLDYYRKETNSKVQRKSFEKHIELAVRENLPLIVHSREAEKDTMDMLRDAKGKVRGVLHCFTGSMEMAQEAIEIGLYISFSGILTFKNAQNLREIATKLPLDKILIETDSPYLAPELYRGKVNEPSYVVEVAKALSEIKGISVEEVGTVTTNNFLNLFDKVKPPMKATILGCGFSAGVPKANGDWGMCNKNNERNRRSRCAIVVEHNGKTILVDTPPELRIQLNKAGITKVDLVLFTHDHADQTHGIDDLKAFGFEKPVKCYGSRETLESLQRRFSHCFQVVKGREKDKFRPFCTPIVIDEDKPIRLDGLHIDVMKQKHGGCESLGFRLQGLAYSNDVSCLSQDHLNRLKNLGIWIVDCIGEKPHVSHSHLEQTLSWIKETEPKHAILTNLGNKLDYDNFKGKCLDATEGNVQPAYDGMVLYIRC